MQTVSVRQASPQKRKLQAGGGRSGAYSVLTPLPSNGKKARKHTSTLNLSGHKDHKAIAFMDLVKAASPNVYETYQQSAHGGGGENQGRKIEQGPVGTEGAPSAAQTTPRSSSSLKSSPTSSAAVLSSSRGATGSGRSVRRTPNQDGMQVEDSLRDTAKVLDDQLQNMQEDEDANDIVDAQNESEQPSTSGTTEVASSSLATSVEDDDADSDVDDEEEDDDDNEPMRDFISFAADILVLFGALALYSRW